MIPNPYLAGPPVGRQSSFVGRKDLIRDVLRILERKEGRTLLLYGQRRIGKTSILQQLEDALLDTGRYVPVFVDMEEYADGRNERMFGELAVRIARALEQEDPEGIGKSPLRFQHWLQDALKKSGERSLVLLFDEFDVLADPGKLKAGTVPLFPQLRQVLEQVQPGVGCLFVIGRNINDLSTAALSLFKGTETRQVSLLKKEDCLALLRLSQPFLTWSPQAEESVWKLTNGHPLLTQMLCSKLWERGKAVTEGAVEEVLPAVLEASGSSLKWLWEGLFPAPKVVASALAGLGPGFYDIDAVNEALLKSGVAVMIGELHQAPDLLKSWDLVELQGEKFRFRVELLRRWILENRPLRLVQEELDRIDARAENLFQVALDEWKDGNLGDARQTLERALRQNRDHARATELYAELLLSAGEVDRAVLELERLYLSRPQVARPRLVQGLLMQAERAADEGPRLELYQKILMMLPEHREAKLRLHQILKVQAERAEVAGDRVLAIRLFVEAGEEAEAQRLRKLAEEEAIRVEEEAIRELIGVDPAAAAQRLEEAVRRWHHFPEGGMRARIHRQTEVRAAWQKVEQAPDAEAALRACGELLLLDPGDPKVVERIWGLSGRLADATEREVRQQAELKERAEEAEMLTQMLRDQERNFADLRRWSAEKLKAQADATAVERGELEKKLRDAQRREDELGRKSQANVAKYRQESEELRKEQARLEKEMEVRKAALAEANRLEQELKAAVETQRVTLPPIGRPLG